MPPDATLSQHADRAQLGPFVSLHRGPKDMLWLALGSVLLGAALLSYLLWQDYVPENQRQDILTYVLPGAGALFIVVGIVGFFRVKGRALQFHHAGLVYKEGSRIRTLRYADVLAVDLDITERDSNTGTSYSGRLAAMTRDGQEFRIQPNLENLDKVIDTLVSNAGPSVIGFTVNELRQGRVLDCGALTLRPDGIAGPKGVIPWTSVEDIDESSESGMLSNDTKVFMTVRSREGTKFKVLAGRVRNRSYLSAISDAMQPPAKESKVQMSLQTLQAQDQLDPMVGKAVRPLMGAHWRGAQVIAEARGDGEIQNLYVVDPTSGEWAQPSHELVDAVRRVFALHRQHRTGVDKYKLTLSPTPEGKWSLSSELDAQ